ncbi:MAG: extracellular solute-binding protein [Candidatus Atribacteria bacterium]|nr:MAG: extracellular solute-binding protein [Candidatus Atribacteria bacterium]
MNRDALLIHRDGDTPLYRQIADILRDRIKRGIFEPGSRIPTEHELCDSFGVSRISVRQALSELVGDDLLEKRQGSGTYVSRATAGGAQVVRIVVTEDQWVTPLDAAVDSFNLENQDKPIAIETQVVGRPQLRSNILGAVGRGEAPDIGLLDWAWVAEFASLQFLCELEVFDPAWVEGLRSDSYSAFVDKASPALHSVQPEANVSLIWYRRDWLRKVKLKPPETWDALVDAAKCFVSDGKPSLAFAGGTIAGETTTYQLLPFVWAAGDRFLAGQQTTLGDQAVHAVRFLVDLVHKHRVASQEVAFYPWDQSARMFACGEVAFAVGGSYEKTLIQKIAGWKDQEFHDRVGCIPIPSPIDGSPATVAGGMAYVIFRQSKKSHLAFEVLKRVVSPDIMRSFCVSTGRSPTRMSVVRSLDPTRDRFIKEVAELLHMAHRRSSLAEYFRVSEQFQIMMESAITRQLSPEAAVERARGIIRILIRERS